MSKYVTNLENLMKNLVKALDEVNEEFETWHGFVGLLIPTRPGRNIEVIHNCASEKDLIKILHITVDQLKKENELEVNGDKH